MGEYSKLTQMQIQSFIHMLYSYQEGIANDSLGRIEFEKLCVLYFTAALKQHLFSEQMTYEDHCYSVCYSLYGPRMSSGSKAYSISSDSALITDFTERRKYVSMQTEGKYQVTRDINIDNKKLSIFAEIHAEKYSKLKAVFDDVAEQENELKKQDQYKQTLWNQYVHTYSQFLTLLAIGEVKKNQFLSLCAELQLVTNMDETFFDFNDSEKFWFSQIISGINSGIWKYFCYKEDALLKTINQIEVKDEEVYRALMIDLDEEDKYDNQGLLDMINRAGNILYRVAFFIQNLAVKFNKIDYFHHASLLESDYTNDRKEFNIDNVFSKNAYFGEFSDIRDKIDKRFENMGQVNMQNLKQEFEYLKSECQQILDYCNLYLETNNQEYNTVGRIIFVYSAENNLPLRFDNICDVRFKDVTKDNTLKAFVLPNTEIGSKILGEIIKATIQLPNIVYIVFDITKESDQAIHIENTLVGSTIKKMIENEISIIKEAPNNTVPQMVFIRSREIKGSFVRSGYKFVPSIPEPTKFGYTRTVLSISLDEKSSEQDDLFKDTVELTQIK